MHDDEMDKKHEAMVAPVRAKLIERGKTEREIDLYLMDLFEGARKAASAFFYKEHGGDEKKRPEADAIFHAECKKALQAAGFPQS